MEGDVVARQELLAEDGYVPRAACVSCARCTKPCSSETTQPHRRTASTRESGECEKRLSGSSGVAWTAVVLASLTCCPGAHGFISISRNPFSGGQASAILTGRCPSVIHTSPPGCTWDDYYEHTRVSTGVYVGGVTLKALAKGESGDNREGQGLGGIEARGYIEEEKESSVQSDWKASLTSLSGRVRGSVVAPLPSSSTGKQSTSTTCPKPSPFVGFSSFPGPFRPLADEPTTCPTPMTSSARREMSLSGHKGPVGTPAGEFEKSGSHAGDDDASPRRRISPFRWMSDTLRRRVGWRRSGAGAGVAARAPGMRWSSARRVASERGSDEAQRTSEDASLEGRHAAGNDVEAFGQEGTGHDGDGGDHRDVLEHWVTGWNLSGWLSDARDHEKVQWLGKEKRDGGRPGLTWGSGANSSRRSNKWGGRLVEKRFDDFQIRTVARIHSLLGREDQAEELMLKMIRDPYLLGDASWVPGSVDETAEWKRLEVHHKKISTKLLKDVMQDPERSLAMSAEYEGTILDYSRMNVSQLTMKLLFDLAKRQGLKEKIQAMYSGEKINNTEDRAVLHVALRMDKDEDPVMVDGVNVVQQVHETLDKVKAFSEAVRSGRLRGATNKHLRNIVAVGIGGSYLGPEFVHEAFKTQEYNDREQSELYRLRFLSNVDPVDVRRTLYDLDPEETLVVVISKTFTTAETMLNARTARQWLWDAMGKDPKVVEKHMAACASESASKKVVDFGIPLDRLFPLWDWVGGRYSVCSSVGALPLSLKYGYQPFENFLAGAQSMDKHFLHAPLEKNIPVLMGLLGVWNISFMGYKTRTILPYAEALLKFPAHIQQLAMESNGKRVTRGGRRVSYDIGQVDFGEPGTNGQHSFFQLLHMGQICPAEFIGFIESQHPLHVEGETVCSHDELMANFFAQPDALAVGKGKEELTKEGCHPDLIPHRTFDGNRPSLSLLVPKVNSYHLGQLLALYEHRTAVEGFMWDINSFDQWGVELGKSLATTVRKKMQAFRTHGQEAKATTGLNPSTQRLMSRYLQQSDSFVRRVGNVNHRSKNQESKRH